METKEITKTVYIANDGKEFLMKEDCEKHEKFVEEILSRIKYFCIRCHPDLTETGYYQHKIYVAVFSGHFFHEKLLLNGHYGNSVIFWEKVYRDMDSNHTLV